MDHDRLAQLDQIRTLIERLAESEARFRTLAEATSAAIFIVQHLKIRYANPAARYITGYTAEELLERELWRIAHPAYQNILQLRGFGSQWSKGIPARYELKIVTKSGDERWVDMTAGEMEFGGQPAWVVTAFDITERDLAEEALRKAKNELELRVEERTSELSSANEQLRQMERQAQAAAEEARRRADQLEILFKSMVDAVVVMDSEGVIRKANEAAIATYGYDPVGLPREQAVARLVLQRPDGSRIPPEEIPSALAQRGQIVENQPIRVKNAQGREVNVVASAAPLHDSEGNLFGTVAVWHDVTEQERLLSQVEQERQRVNELAQMLMEERDILQTIMENTRTHLAYLDARFNFVLVNSSYARGSGYTRDELIGRNHFELFPHSENQAIFERVRDTGQPVEFFAKPFVFPNQPERGVTYWDWTLVPILDEKGAVQGLVISLLDVTERVNAAREIEEARRQTELAAQDAQRQARKMEAIFASMTDAVVVYDGEGRPLQANPAAASTFGLDPLRLDRQAFCEQLAIRQADGRPLSLEALPSSRALKGEVVVNERLRIRNALGQEMVLLVSASPLSGGERIAGAVSLWHDVTEREQLLARLEAEQARLNAILQNAPEAIVVVDQEARLLFANPAAEQLFQQPIPVGQGYTAFGRLKICYADGTPYESRNLPLTRSALDGESHHNVEIVIQLPDGLRRFALVDTAPIRDREDNPAGAVGVFQDITLRRQAEEELRKNAAQGQLLASLSQTFVETQLDYPVLLQTIARRIAEIFEDACVIRLASEDGQWLLPVALHEVNSESSFSLKEGLGAAPLRSYEGPAGRVFQTGEPLLLPFIPPADVEEIEQPAFWGGFKRLPVRSALIVPLHRQGKPVGTLSVFRFNPNDPYTLDDLIFFQDLAGRISLAMENSRLYAAQARRAQELDALQQATAALLTTLDLEALLNQILDAAMRAIPRAEKASLHLATQENGGLSLRASTGQPPETTEGDAPSPLAEAATIAIRERRPILIRDRMNEPGATPPPAGRQAAAFRSAICAPLLLGERALGVLSLESSQAQAFSDPDLRLLASFANTTTMAIQNATLHSVVQKQAITDSVTGLYNRRGFFEFGKREIERARRFGHPLSAIMLDIDRFKQINDAHTHAVGDQVLHELAQRLAKNLREIDILGRYGGEEFAVLLPETDLATAANVAERLRRCVEAEPFLSESVPLAVTVSLGVAQATPGTFDLEALLNQSDLALYAAKEAGRNRVETR